MMVTTATVLIAPPVVWFIVSLITTSPTPFVHSFPSIVCNSNIASSSPLLGIRSASISSPRALQLSAHSLTTAFEWLAEERQAGGVGNNISSLAYSTIDWIDPAADDDEETIVLSRSTNQTEQTGSSAAVNVPIYPLSAVYLPAGGSGSASGCVNYTLNNVDPRNIQMALDLLSSPSAAVASESRCFCAVLSAMDTGRIATIGTLMKIVQADIQYHPGQDPGQAQSSTSTTTSSIAGIARIRLTCRAINIVRIHGISNPQAFSKQSRILRSSEYLRGNVSILNCIRREEASTLPKQLVQDYNLIKTMYQLQIGGTAFGQQQQQQQRVGLLRRHQQDTLLLLFPPSFLYELGNAMPTWKQQDADDDADKEDDDDRSLLFWRMAQEWQSVCHSMMQGKQQLLSADVNELLIEAATRSERGGPLKLPIHVHEMPPSVQRQVQALEVQAQTDYAQFGMPDPILDFQALLGLAAAAAAVTTTGNNVQTNHHHRVLPTPLEWLSFMIARERQRLEAVASSSSASSSFKPSNGP
jgi:hypothetical protein